MPRWSPTVACLVLLLSDAAIAAPPTYILPGCEPSHVVSVLLESGRRRGPRQDLGQWAAARAEQLQAIAARYPREFEPPWQLFVLFTQNRLEGWTALRERWENVRDRWVRAADAAPNDPLALALAGMALSGRDTDAAITDLRQARTLAPGFAWPALQLAFLYSYGKRMDKEEAGRQLTAFFTTCPASADRAAHELLSRVGNAELPANVAAALRADLEKTADPARLRRFETLWALEFRTRPPSEHDALRAQVKKDLARLTRANPKPDPEWLLFLRDGARRAGAPKEVPQAYEDRVVKEFPASIEAYRISMARWRAAHPEPSDHTDRAAWQAYHRSMAAFLADALKRYPGETGPRSAYIGERLEDDDLGEAEGARLIDEEFALGEEAKSWRSPLEPVQWLLERGWRPTRALELARLALVRYDKEAAANENDNLASDDPARRFETREAAWVRSLVLRAALQAGDAEVAGTLKAGVETSVPEDLSLLPDYWANCARLARLEKRQADALAYYQAALQSRSGAPAPKEGKVVDPVRDEARDLWKELGGTDAAWAKWSGARSVTVAARSESGSWMEAKGRLPDFSLADLAGKTWTLKGLNGKALLINLWATWCGPCMAELARVQTLFERTKDRSDVQVLSFNVDSNPGLVAPFVREKRFTFPVVLANDFVMKVLDAGMVIPQNWLVDATGAWRWVGIGFTASAADWEGEMLTKLEGLKK